MRKLKTLLLSSLFLLAPVAVTAQDIESGDLTLVKAAPKPEFIIDGADWQCVDVICHASWVDDMPAVRSCRRIVAEVGPVTAFAWRGKALGADQLAQCNAAARS